MEESAGVSVVQGPRRIREALSMAVQGYIYLVRTYGDSMALPNPKCDQMVIDSIVSGG